MTFTGFPKEALDFYDDLELDNTKSFWEAHKDVYNNSVKAPMVALVTALEDEFGTAKVFRPYRDVRFAKDKTPYKDHQGAYVGAAPGSGWYIQLSSPGVFVGVGYYGPSPDALASIRKAIDLDHSGKEFERLVTGLQRKGWELGGEKLKTTPKGYAADHPRIELLRHKSLTLGKSYGFEPAIHTPKLLTMVRKDWRAARPFVEWVGQHSG
jgi:uncharacterized protein (TIGR02453 family)